MTRSAVFAALLLLAPAVLMAMPSAAAATTSFAWGSDLSQWGSLVDADRNAAISVSTATGMTMIVTDAKDGGPVGWASSTYPTVTAFTAGDGGVERVTRDAHAKGLKVAARFDVFEDSGAAAKYPYASLGGSPVWVDPGCAEVRAYALAQVKELVTKVAIDEINFDHIRYPDASESSKTTLPCTASGADRSAIIASWVKDASAAARAIRPGIVVSISVFAWTMKGPLPGIGQDAALLAPHVDVLRPMIYPVYISSAAIADPYTTTKSYTASGVQTFGGAKIQPWIQGFDTFATRPDLVCAQYKGIVDAGGSGGLVWWFPSTGTTRAYWDKISPCVPASAPAPSTTPSPTPAPTNTTATSGFAVTFTPKAGNNWWVETQATSSLTIAGVSASVNGGAPVALAKNKWGAWTKSFYVPTGAIVKFTATSTAGATNTSGGYRWPTATPVSTSTTTSSSPTTSTSAPFTATFQKGGANNWWVEVRVNASAPLAGVTASVNGGAPVALELRNWGSWAKSFYVPNGAQIVFTATSTTGAKATSAPFTWP